MPKACLVHLAFGTSVSGPVPGGIFGSLIPQLNPNERKIYQPVLSTANRYDVCCRLLGRGVKSDR